MEDPIVSPGAVAPVKDTYRRLSFTVSGRGRLAQLTQLLHEFYSVGHLHQVRALRVKPIPDSKLLEIHLTIDALALDSAVDVNSLSRPPAERFAERTLDDWLGQIGRRNLFAPANHPPKLARIGDQRMRTDRPLSLTAKATDPDPLGSSRIRSGRRRGPRAPSWTPAPGSCGFGRRSRVSMS